MVVENVQRGICIVATLRKYYTKAAIHQGYAQFREPMLIVTSYNISTNCLCAFIPHNIYGQGSARSIIYEQLQVTMDNYQLALSGFFSKYVSHH